MLPDDIQVLADYERDGIGVFIARDMRKSADEAAYSLRIWSEHDSENVARYSCELTEAQLRVLYIALTGAWMTSLSLDGEGGDCDGEF